MKAENEVKDEVIAVKDVEIAAAVTLAKGERYATIDEVWGTKMIDWRKVNQEAYESLRRTKEQTSKFEECRSKKRPPTRPPSQPEGPSQKRHKPLPAYTPQEQPQPCCALTPPHTN